MAAFRDRTLLRLSDPAVLGELLLPPGDTDGAGVRTMLAATYDLSAARVDRVTGARVQAIALQRPLYPAGRVEGGWSQTVPAYTRTDVALTMPGAPVWVDLLVQLTVTVVTEVDTGGVESVLARGFDEFTTFDEFRARFAFFDLDAFLTEHHLSTVEELRDAFDYVVADIRLRAPGPFDPDDPANTHILPVTLAAVVADPFDVTEGLRATRLVRDAVKGLVGAAPPGIPGESLEPYATAVVFDGTALGDGLTAADVQRLYAAEGVLGLALTAN